MEYDARWHYIRVDRWNRGYPCAALHYSYCTLQWPLLFLEVRLQRSEKCVGIPHRRTTHDRHQGWLLTKKKYYTAAVLPEKHVRVSQCLYANFALHRILWRSTVRLYTVTCSVMKGKVMNKWWRGRGRGGHQTAHCTQKIIFFATLLCFVMPCFRFVPFSFGMFECVTYHLIF